ncbi:uncharacterized protein IL334_006155 [Kwoniella shivajii]|uniref:Mediator of RNA polymerase II transcription subunit 18 n=1 Tax=Kwoniella shivajii TaxID=564305 RepID=A0ABZ1D887_9TREE|nr:hypothetical protein IL334_006155 [Kwoniella shivajii]
MTTTSSLEPTLYTLLPPSFHSSFSSHLSLQSIHAESFHIVDRIYTTSNPVIQGQLRNLRFRSRLLHVSSNCSQLDFKRTGKGKGKGKEEEQVSIGKEGGKGFWIHNLSYVSAPLRGQEYSQTSTRAVIGIDILSMEDEDDIEDFINSLGFDHSHSYSMTGTLFHIPLPLPTSNPITIQISITHLTRIPKTTSSSTTLTSEITSPRSKEPWLVQIYPSRPVNAVPQPGDVSYAQLVEIMNDLISRIGVQGLEWSTAGR